jgi:hypothetical protein
MTKKEFWLGVLVMALAFGLVLSGCKTDDDDGGDSGDGGSSGGGNKVTLKIVNQSTDASLRIQVANGQSWKVVFDHPSVAIANGSSKSYEVDVLADYGIGVGPGDTGTTGLVDTHLIGATAGNTYTFKYTGNAPGKVLVRE